MKIITFVLMIVLLGQISFVSAQEKSETTSPLNVCEFNISVSIINGANLNDAHLSIVKDAILSQKSFVQGNNTYFKGWAGALKSEGSNYSVEVTNMSNADITITLTTQENPEYNGWTTVHYISGHLTSSNVIIYDTLHIPATALANIIRHEMGHALGLGHTTDISSIMYPLLPFTPKYISEIDLAALKSDSSMIHSSNGCI